MALDLMQARGTPLERQVFTWRELAGAPYSKLDNDAFTRVRVIVMNGIEHDQQTLINWLNPGDQSALETTIGYEQAAIELTASLAQAEPDTYLAQVYRFGLLEDFDHLYRYSAFMDRVEGKDANTIVQSY